MVDMTPGGYEDTGKRVEIWKGDMIADWMSAKRKSSKPMNKNIRLTEKESRMARRTLECHSFLRSIVGLLLATTKVISSFKGAMGN